MTKKKLLKDVQLLEDSITQVMCLAGTLIEELDKTMENGEMDDRDQKKYFTLKTDLAAGWYFLNGSEKEDSIPKLRSLIKKYK